MRPGISNEMLARAGVRHVSAGEAKVLCGLAEAGLWLPYRDLNGGAIRDGYNDYGRLRLDQPQGKQKYHQAAGTTVHAYLPPTLSDTPGIGGDLFIIEGEFKSVALTEAGFPAVGISGFYGFGLKDNGGLVPELAAVIEQRKPTRILFCGDSDTALNYFFPLAAVRLANLVQPLPVWLPRIPLNAAGKGADDCRAKLNGAFADWWRERIAQAIEVKADTDPALLMMELLEREETTVVGLSGKARKDVEDRLVKLAAAFEKHPFVQERVLTFLEEKLALKRRALNKAVKAALKKTKPEVKPQPLDAFYDPARKCYWIPNNRGEMIEITETSLQRHLINAGYSCEPEDAATSPLADEVIRIQRERDVLYAGPLAGHGVGPQEMCGQRILVTRGPRLILPQPGDCPTIENLLLGLLDDPDPNINQIIFLLGWLKIAYESLLHGQLRPGQALALAGPKDCGKSLLQNLITEMLGGRSAKPYRYMSGATEFNGDLFGAEHLMIEDEFANTDIRTRRNFGARIKDFTVNQVQSCHGKNRPAVSLKPFWRVSISLNEEPENLLILPPIDESLEDKLILLKASKAPLPDDIGTSTGREKYWAQLMAEMPMFLDLLVNFRIPAALHSGRFGVKHFQHPALLAAVNEMSPEMRLMGLIDAALQEKKDHVGQWKGTATDLERMLNESAVAFEVRRLLDWNNATGTYLGRLAKKLPNRIRAERTNSSRTWIVLPAHWKMGDEPLSIADPLLV